MRSQIYIAHRRNFLLAKRDLELATANLKSVGSLDMMFVKKWSVILQCIEFGKIEPLKIFRIEACKRQHWETIRDVDYYLLKFEFSQLKYDHVVFGTPFSSFREKIKKKYRLESKFVLSLRCKSF